MTSLIRKKYRWLALEIIADRHISKDEFAVAIKRKVYELFGSFGDVTFSIEDFDSQRGFAVIKCLSEDLLRLRTALGLLREVQGTPVVLNDLYCSGTLKKLREKLSTRRLFAEILKAVSGVN